MANQADTRSPFEKFYLAAGETTVVDELIADRATGPTAAQHGLIAVKTLLANLAQPGLDPQQHRLPVSACFSNAHGREYSEAVAGNTSRVEEHRSVKA
jgi:hypothetical protein